jgi:hypothetical protein
MKRKRNPSLQPAAHCGMGDAAFSDDYASAHWFGRGFSFTPIQRPVVKALVRNWLNGTPDVSVEYLLAQADSQARRLRDLFRGHDAFGSMIVRGDRRDTFRIAGAPTKEFEKIPNTPAGAPTYGASPFVG